MRERVLEVTRWNGRAVVRESHLMFEPIRLKTDSCYRAVMPRPRRTP